MRPTLPIYYLPSPDVMKRTLQNKNGRTVTVQKLLWAPWGIASDVLPAAIADRLDPRGIKLIPLC